MLEKTPRSGLRKGHQDLYNTVADHNHCGAYCVECRGVRKQLDAEDQAHLQLGIEGEVNRRMMNRAYQEILSRAKEKP